MISLLILHPLWGRSMPLSVDAFNLTCSSANLGESHHDAADQSYRDIVDSNPWPLAEPSDASGSSGVGPTVAELPIDCSNPRGIGFAEAVNFTPPSKSLSRATETASTQLVTYVLEPHAESRPRGKTRSQTVGHSWK